MGLLDLLLEENDHEKEQKKRGFVPDYQLTHGQQDTPSLPAHLFFQNKDIFMSKHSRYASYPEHSHQFLELNYVYRGTCRQNINGEEITLVQGDILLMDKGSRHAISCLSEEDILINILFQDTQVSIDWLGQLQNENSLLYCLLLNNQTRQQANYLIFPARDNQHIQTILEQMMTEYFLPQSFSEIMLSHYLQILFYELSRNLSDLTQQEFLQNDSPYLQALRLIDRDYSDLTLQKLADRLSFNKNYLSNLIKDKSGQTFTQLVTQKKLLKAQLLLQSTRLPIQEISLQVGFSNKTYFYKHYKKMFGYGPGEERKVGV